MMYMLKGDDGDPDYLVRGVIEDGGLRYTQYHDGCWLDAMNNLTTCSSYWSFAGVEYIIVGEIPEEML